MPIDALTVTDYYSTTQEQFEYLLAIDQLKIPANQRPWEWDSRKLEDLWEDLRNTILHFYQNDFITETHPSSHNPHFFGFFVLEEPNTGSTLAVIDGQQRLTAMMLILASLRNIVDGIAPGTQTQLTNRRGRPASSQSALLQQLNQILISDYAGHHPKPRLLLEGRYRDLFEHYIVSSESTTIKEDWLSINPSDNHFSASLEKSFRVIQEHIAEHFSRHTASTKLDLAYLVKQTAEKAFFCNVTKVSNAKRMFSYNIFRSLNTNPQELNAADKIKNELFYRERDGAHHNLIETSWNNLLDTLETIKTKPDLFLWRHTLAGGTHTDIKEKDIAPSITTDIIQYLSSHPGLPLANLVDSWVDSAIDYTALVNPSPHTIVAPDLRQELEFLFRTLSAGLATITLLAGYQEWYKTGVRTRMNDFTQLVSIMHKFMFRNLTCAQQETTSLRVVLTTGARLIRDGQNFSVVKDHFREHLADPSAIERRLLDPFRKSPLTKYVLKYLEEHSRPTPAAVTGTGCHVEHVLPKKPDTTPPYPWSYAQDPVTGDPNDLHETLVHQIGNQILLERPINQSIKNRAFIEKRNGVPARGRSRKKDGYKDSGYAHATTISRKRKWTETDIRKRTQDLIADAQNVWSF